MKELKRNIEKYITVLCERYPVLKSVENEIFEAYLLLEELYKNGAMYAAMSGSGSSVFGLFAPDITIPDINFGARSFVFKGKL